MKFTKSFVWSTCILGLALCCTDALAYYRGTEYEPRSYPFDAEYYLDMVPLLPTPEEAYTFRTRTNAYMGAVGSYTTSELFNFQDAKFNQGLGRDFSMNLRYWANQDFDGVYDHFQVGLQYDLTPNWNIELLGSPMAEKEYADIGGAVTWLYEGSQVRTVLLLPNFEFNDKNEYEGVYVSEPINLQLDWLIRVTEQLYFLVDADLDFKSETEYVTTEFNFDYNSYKGEASAVYDLTEQQKLQVGLGGEQTEKNRIGFSGGDPNDYNVTRNVFEARAQYIRTLLNMQRLAGGLIYISFDEDNAYPNNGTESVEIRHTSRMLFGTWDVPFSSLWTFKTGLYWDFVDHTETRPDAPENDSDSSGNESKIPLSLQCNGDTWRVEAGVSFQLDSVAFGGGFARAAVQF